MALAFRGGEETATTCAAEGEECDGYELLGKNCLGRQALKMAKGYSDEGGREDR